MQEKSYLCNIKHSDSMDTDQQYDNAVASCRAIFAAKLHDYGPSWRILRPCSVTDQLYIKAKRIRSLQTKGNAAVDEGILPEFMALVNYGIVGVIQLQLGWSDTKDIDTANALELYDRTAAVARKLFMTKNHDYDEAWRGMRVASYVDFILTKIERVKEIEDNDGCTKVSEGIDANYFDIVNYAVFGIIKLTE